MNCANTAPNNPFAGGWGPGTGGREYGCGCPTPLHLGTSTGSFAKQILREGLVRTRCRPLERLRFRINPRVERDCHTSGSIIYLTAGARYLVGAKVSERSTGGSNNPPRL